MLLYCCLIVGSQYLCGFKIYSYQHLHKLIFNLQLKRKSPQTNSTSVGTGRGFEDYYDEHDHDHETTTTLKPMKQGRYTDPWAGYYDWIINEGSFKFWSVFQVSSFIVYERNARDFDRVKFDRSVHSDVEFRELLFMNAYKLYIKDYLKWKCYISTV